MAAAVTILIGTAKGAFFLEGDADRSHWHLRGPFCDGWPVSHMIGCPRTGRIWAAAGDDWHGSGVWRSDDGGENWELSLLANGQLDAWLASDSELAAHIGQGPAPPAPYTGRLEALWALGLAGDRLHAGGKPGLLFVSTDGGTVWEEVAGLCDHPSRGEWQAGGAGLVVHSILSAPEAPERLWVGISAAGMFASEDGGTSWERRNRRSNAPGAAGADAGTRAANGSGDVGLCVHNVVRAPGAGGDLLYQQNHEGVFRSPDGGRSWDEITPGLPSGFGFPVAVHPHAPDTLWVLPLNGDMAGRWPPDAAAAVWRSRDGGARWEALRSGLPQAGCYFTVLRQAMATDQGDPAGLYFGTSSGSLFASADEGESWTEPARHLPAIRSVEILWHGGHGQR